MKLLENLPSHRSETAYEVAMNRVGDYGLRAAGTRLLLVAGIAVTVVVFDPDWRAIVIVLAAAVASYTSATDNYYLRTQTTPWEPLALFSQQVNLRTIGRNRPNVPGILELLVYVPLASVGPYVITEAPDAARVLCFAAALGYIASCVCAVFTDPAFYNPDVEPPVAEELVRLLAGLITALLATTFVLFAPLDAQARWTAVGFCAVTLLIQLRIRETDRLMVEADSWAGSQQREGRRAVTQAMHRDLGPALAMLYKTVQTDRPADPRIWDLTRSAVGGYRLLLHLDLEPDVDTDWPGTLESHLLHIQGFTGTRFDLTVPNRLLSAADRKLATLVLDDLGNNAAKSGALVCAIELSHDVGSRQFRASAIDNGDPIHPNSSWLKPGTGSFRLRQRLLDTGHGELTLEMLPDGRKMATAVWTETIDGEPK